MPRKVLVLNYLPPGGRAEEKKVYIRNAIHHSNYLGPLYIEVGYVILRFNVFVPSSIIPGPKSSLGLLSLEATPPGGIRTI